MGERPPAPVRVNRRASGIVDVLPVRAGSMDEVVTAGGAVVEAEPHPSSGGTEASRGTEASDDAVGGGTPDADETPEVTDVEVRPRDVEHEFGVFVTSASPALGRLALLLCGDVYRAEELVQQTLVRTYVAWDRARQGDPLVYARRVLANQRIDTWRRHRREVLLAPGDVPEASTPGPGADHAERDRVVRALVLLPHQRRRVVVLRYLLDLPEAEVAETLGISVGAVRSAASRGLGQLRRTLGDAVAHPAGRPATQPDDDPAPYQNREGSR